jgi:hypothetical protein
LQNCNLDLNVFATQILAEVLTSSSEYNTAIIKTIANNLENIAGNLAGAKVIIYIIYLYEIIYFFFLKNFYHFILFYTQMPLFNITTQLANSTQSLTWLSTCLRTRRLELRRCIRDICADV